MESVWQNVHAKFMDQLLNRRVDEMLESEDWLRSMRYNHKEVKWWQKRAGHIFEERGLNLCTSSLPRRAASAGTTKTSKRRQKAPVRRSGATTKISRRKIRQRSGMCRVQNLRKIVFLLK